MREEKFSLVIEYFRNRFSLRSEREWEEGSSGNAGRGAIRGRDGIRQAKGIGKDGESRERGKERDV